jgi:phosphate transport system ATP-binding protein
MPIVTEPESAAEQVASQSQAKLAELAAARAVPPDEAERREAVLELAGVTVSYGGAPAVRDVGLEVYRNRVTAFIGPSGCGKTTILRSLNRLNDLVPGARVEGTVRYHGHDVYAGEVDPVELRRRIGMVFQRPNPFPKSIYENVAFGLRLHGMRDGLDDRVEHALRRAALWDEVHDRLKTSALALSGGQQQRLCIARALAVEPDVLLMDEPASALDPIATLRIEDLLAELKRDYTIVIVTHNMQQAARVADMTAFFSVESGEGEARTGVLVEYAPTADLFMRPADSRTEAYVTGRFG